MDLDAHPATTPEIRSLCADLGVLGRVDFKNLLKWRLAVRKSRGLDGKRKAALRGGVAAADDDDDDDEETRGDASADASDSDEKILEEMAELQQGVNARARRDKKKKAKLRAKERMRTALGLVGQDEEGATGASEMDLFSLARIKSKGGLNAVQAAAAPGIDASRDSDDDLGDVERRAGARGKYDDSSEEEADASDGRANDARLEAELDLMWREYKARHGKKGVKFTEKSGGRDARVAIGAGEIGSDDDDDEDDQAGAAMRRAGQRALAQAMQDAAPANPLLFDPDAPAKKKTKGPAAATDWFANDLFGQAAPEVGSKTQAKSEAKAELRKAREAEARAKAAAEEDGSDDDEEDGFDDDDEYFDGDGDDADANADDADDESEEEEAVRRGAKPSSRKRAKTTVGADVGDADSDEEDYDAIRASSAAKARREEAKAAKTKAREEAKANSLKKAKKNAASTPGGVSKKRAANAYDDTYDDDTDSSEDDGGAGLSGADPTGTDIGRARRGKDNAGFLEAPAEPEARSDSSGSDTDSDPDDISDGEKAEILAIGKNMIRKKDRVRRRKIFGFSFLSRFTAFGFGFSVFPSRAGEDDLSLKNNRHRLNLDGRSPECPGT